MTQVLEMEEVSNKEVEETYDPNKPSSIYSKEEMEVYEGELMDESDEEGDGDTPNDYIPDSQIPYPDFDQIDASSNQPHQDL